MELMTISYFADHFYYYFTMSSNEMKDIAPEKPLLQMSENFAQILLDKEQQQSPPKQAAARPPRHSSSKHVFPPFSCLPYENNIVYCFVLSVWDNIIGPQTVQVWKRDKSSRKRTTLNSATPSSSQVSSRTQGLLRYGF